MISFTHSRIYKDIGSKAFFTMATLLMPLLENVPTNNQTSDVSLIEKKAITCIKKTCEIKICQIASFMSTMCK